VSAIRNDTLPVIQADLVQGPFLGAERPFGFLLGKGMGFTSPERHLNAKLALS
jgi:hypothetical protein